MPSIDKESVQGKPIIGHTVVGTTAVKVCQHKGAIKGILIKAGSENTVDVFLGTRPSVLADNSETGGFPIPPGAALELPIEDPSLLYVVATEESQDIAWVIM